MAARTSTTWGPGEQWQTPEKVLQRQNALAKANMIRLYKCEKGRQLAAGEITLVDLVGDPLVENVKVAFFLRAVPRVGPHKTRMALNACHCSAVRPMGQVSLQLAERLLIAAGVS